MKTTNDFKVLDRVAYLKGISYAEEVRVVDKFLKENPDIKFASVQTMDNRYFELKDNKLVYTMEEKFLNPYFVEEKEIENKEISSIISDDKILNLESRIINLEDRLNKYDGILTKIALIINNKE